MNPNNPTPAPLPTAHLPPQEWEPIIESFLSLSPSRYSPHLHLPLLPLSLHSLLLPQFPLHLKLLLLSFLSDSPPHLLSLSPSSLPSLLHTFHSLSPSDPTSLRDHFLVSLTSLHISLLDFSPTSISILEPIVELLLSSINRPNHSADRHSRSVAAECLRQLESAFPLLLSDVAAHLFTLAQSERTHASQSYLLLLADVIRNIVFNNLLCSPNSILSNSAPLVPFSAPHQILVSDQVVIDGGNKLLPTDQNLKEVRRVMAFLLESPQGLTPAATMELVKILVEVAGELEKHIPAVAALLKVQFSGLIYSYDPILCHVVVMMLERFPEVFTGGDEVGVLRRLAVIPKDGHQMFVFRVLAVHWLLGVGRGKEEVVEGLAGLFYPGVFDPLALKAVKLDAMASVARGLDGGGGGGKVVRLFEDGLVCVEGFKWLPPWSTETSVAFRTLHKFLIGVVPHCSGEEDAGTERFHRLLVSTIFGTLKSMLVKLALEHRRLVPVIANFVDRLLQCKAHREVGEWLLQTFDEDLIPKLETGYNLTSYFPIFERIGASEAVPPHRLLDLLMEHMVSLTEKHGPDSGLRSWSKGSSVLGICRLIMMNHRSSRVFLALSRLLAFTCQYFPDLEVRDNARIYLRMLLCIPGKKLRNILNLGEKVPGMPAAHPGSFFQAPSPRSSHDPKKSTGVSSYIHLERVVPLIVRQSWSLTLPNLEIANAEASSFDGVVDVIVLPPAEPEKESELMEDKIGAPQEPLRVMDAKDAEILGVLRRHFACIPDYRHMPAIKITIPCILRFDSETFSRVWGFDLSLGSDEVDGLPALYATTLTFSSTAKYGSIPSCRVPFLLGEPIKTGFDLVPVGNDLEEDSLSSFRALVIVELEPREPMPGLIDIAIKANVENGQIVSGFLQSISVGIEDMFLSPSIPSDVTEDGIPNYYLGLFHALWEACGNSANIGRETFLLREGKGAVAISGTRSVKLLDVSLHSLINAIEQYLAPFVVSVTGETVMKIVKNNGVIRDVIWGDDFESFSPVNADALVPYSENIPLQLEYVRDENDDPSVRSIRKRNMGTILILIFLPPRFHLLFEMEIGELTTLVRIRTDHWPCLAYVDDYLESLFLT